MHLWAWVLGVILWYYQSGDSKCGSFRIFQKCGPPPLLHGHNLSGGQYMASVARACSVLGGIMPHRRDSITWEQSPAPLLPALSRKFWNTYNIPVIEGQKVRGKSMIYFDWVKMSWPGHDAHHKLIRRTLSLKDSPVSSGWCVYLVLRLTSHKSTTKVLPQSAVQSVCKFLRFLQSPPSEWRDAAWNILNWSRCEQFTIYAKYFSHTSEVAEKTSKNTFHESSYTVPWIFWRGIEQSEWSWVIPGL